MPAPTLKADTDSILQPLLFRVGIHTIGYEGAIRLESGLPKSMNIFGSESEEDEEVSIDGSIQIENFSSEVNP